MLQAASSGRHSQRFVDRRALRQLRPDPITPRPSSGVIGNGEDMGARVSAARASDQNAVCPGFIARGILGGMPERVLRALEEKCRWASAAKPE